MQHVSYFIYFYKLQILRDHGMTTANAADIAKIVVKKDFSLDDPSMRKAIYKLMEEAKQRAVDLGANIDIDVTTLPTVEAETALVVRNRRDTEKKDATFKSILEDTKQLLTRSVVDLMHTAHINMMQGRYWLIASIIVVLIVALVVWVTMCGCYRARLPRLNNNNV